MSLLSSITFSVWFILPAWCANIFLTINNKIINLTKIKDYPLDLKKRLFKQRILGDSVTIYGLIISIVTGTFIGLIQNRILEGFLLGLGAYTGNALDSFIKRRLKMNQGNFFPILDHVDHTAFSLLIIQPINPQTTEIIIIILLLTIVLHPIICVIGYFLKLKSVPW